MTDPISSVIPEVKITHGQAVTTSIAVASFFGKLHKDVLRKIDTLECSPAFTSANFCAHVQPIEIGNGATRDSKYYEITKNGFIFLVMGFTGKKAAAFKEAYIAEFDRMEEALIQQNRLPPEIDPMNMDIYQAIRNGKVAFVKHYQTGTLVTVDEALALLKARGWLVMPREELAGKLMSL